MRNRDTKPKGTELDVAGGAALSEIPARKGPWIVRVRTDHRTKRYVKGSTSIRTEEYPRLVVLDQIEGEPARKVGRECLDRQQPRFVADHERRTGERGKQVWIREDE